LAATPTQCPGGEAAGGIAASGNAQGCFTPSSTSGTSPVQLATTGSNITLSGEQTIDGVLTSSSRVLVKDQTTQTQNGVYVSGSGAWTRASDFASPVTGNNVYVTAGSTNFDTVFAVDTPNPITVGSSQLTFRPNGPYAFVYPGAFPCDIVAAGGQTCKAAYSLVRRMFASYSGNLYQVTRASDSTTTNVGTLSSGLVNTATETAFCAGTTCTRSKIYDQTGTSANDLIPYSASPEYYVAVPSSWTTMPSGLVLPINRFGMTNGYATASGASGLPSGNSSITVYMLAENYSEGGIINGCCGLFNQSENPVRDAGMGKMFGAAFSTGNAVDCVNLGTGTGPWAGVDLEEGVCLYGGTPSQNYLAVLGKYNTSGTTFAVKSSDITQGRWTTLYNAGLPAGYTMNLEQNVTVGMGGDGTPSPGNWMEGAVIAGTTSDATDNALQGNFVSFFGPAQTAVPNTVRANLTYSINGYTSPATTALPAKGLFLNQVVYTTNAASYSDCTAGAGTTFNACRWNGTIWTPLFPTGGSMVWPTFTGLAKYGGSSNWVTPTYADVVALFGSGSCSGYLKNDGTCSTTSGMVWPSSPGYALWQSGSSWSTPSLTDSGGNVNSSEPIVVNASSVASQLSLTYNTGHALVPGSSTTAVYGVDASGNAVGSEAGGAASRFCTATNGICSGSGGTEQLASSRSLVSSDCGQIIRLGGYSLTLPNPQPANPCSFTVQAAGAGVVVLGSGATYNGLSTAPTLSCNDQLIRISATSGSTTDYVGDAGVAAGSNTTLTCSSYQIAVNAAPVSTTWPTTPGYALWQSGTSWSAPHLTDNSTTVSSSEPLAITHATNQLVTGTSTNTTTSTYPASSGAVTLTYPNTSEYMVGANSDTTTTHVLHATAVPGVYNSAAIAAGDIPATAIPAVAVPTPSASITLAAPSGIAVCTGTCTVSVPVPAAGYQFCILNDDNVGTAITLSALGSSARYENSARTAYGTAGTGTLVLSAAAGNLVCIVGRDSTHYFTTNYVGVVTVN
jgi:hypothetical protein